jgi:arylsulfatase A-like enzyme
VDLYPTLLDLAGIEPPRDQILDGVSLVPIFRGAATLDRQRLFWHFPCYVGKSTPSSALREGDFKLIEFFEDGGRRELYNLKSDPNEQRDLATSMPDKAAAMYQTLRAWQTETGALLPRGPNPNYDPKAERPRGNQGGRTAGNRPPEKNPPGKNKGRKAESK